MDPVTMLTLIELHHEELRADAARARRPTVVRRAQHRTLGAWLLHVAGRWRPSRAAA